MIRKTMLGSMVVGALLLTVGEAQAADTLADGVKKACNKELTTFCKGVPQGEGRILACLYAFEDKVSDGCIYALYDGAEQLKQAVAALQFAAGQCKDDLQKFCANVQPGQGRALACIQKNQKNASQPCTDALKQTGLWKK
jgi:Cysteine rich repeat